MKFNVAYLDKDLSVTSEELNKVKYKWHKSLHPTLHLYIFCFLLHGIVQLYYCIVLHFYTVFRYVELSTKDILTSKCSHFR